jgi:hypothetical protein
MCNESINNFPNLNGGHANQEHEPTKTKEEPMKWVNVLRWSKVIALAGALSFAVNLAASADGGRSDEQDAKLTPAAATLDASEDYVVVLTDKDTTPLQIYQKYLDSADFWRELAEHNLLGKDIQIRIPKSMLKNDQIPARITKFSGRVEIARNFDWKWVKVVPDMLVQQGDWVRTRSRSSVEILQDDGTVIRLKPNSKAMVDLSGSTESARGEVRVTKVKLESGSLVAKVKKLLQRDSRFEIQTPTATSFIRGTEFRVKVEDNSATRLEVLEGAVDFGSEAEKVSVDGNFGSLVNSAGDTPSAPHALPSAPAVLFTPEDKQVLDESLATYQFSWATVENASKYHLEIASDLEFKQLVEEAWLEGANADMMTLRIDALEPGTYFWRVSAVDDQGYESAWSESRYFVYPLKLQ